MFLNTWKAFQYFNLAILVLSFLIIAQNSIRKLNQEETRVVFAKRKSVNISCPSFTICPWRHYTHLIDGDNYLDIFGDSSANQLPLDVSLKVNDEYRNDVERRKMCRYHSENGCIPCVSFHPPADVHLNHNMITIIVNYDGKYAQFLLEIHEKHESFAELRHFDFSKIHHFKLKTNHTLEVMMDTELIEHNAIKINGQKCDEKNKLNFQDHFEKLVRQKLNCSLPWHEKVQGREVCKTKHEFLLYLEFMSNFSDESFLLSLKRNCQNWIRERKFFYDNLIKSGISTSVIIRLFGFKQDIVVEREVYVYDWNNFIGDFGGYFGLLLGGSIPAFLKVLQDSINLIRVASR